MPINKRRCESCGTKKKVCPECGSTFVTPRDNPGTPSPTEIVDHGLGAQEVSYKHVCWNCGWQERVTITIERE
jgi:hypothetical protein